MCSAVRSLSSDGGEGGRDAGREEDEDEEDAEIDVVCIFACPDATDGESLMAAGVMEASLTKPPTHAAAAPAPAHALELILAINFTNLRLGRMACFCGAGEHTEVINIHHTHVGCLFSLKFAVWASYFAISECATRCLASNVEQPESWVPPTLLSVHRAKRL